MTRYDYALEDLQNVLDDFSDLIDRDALRALFVEKGEVAHETLFDLLMTALDWQEHTRECRLTP
jgi:hypothetical protein